MGCINSTPAKQPLTSGHINSSSKTTDTSTKSTTVGRKEDKIELAFRVKRANIFTHGISLSDEKNTEIKNVPKSPQQQSTILGAIAENYIFANMSPEDLDTVVRAMEVVDVSPGENVITQGQNGDYFYVIYRGKFTVIVNGKPVSQLSDGASFGELALLYNSPRQATIRADSDATLFSLDRDTYKFIIAQSSSSRTQEVKRALSRVPLLADLTEEQLEKISDTVEVFPYNAGDVIIKKGAEGNVFYMIKEGVVTVTDIGAQFNDHTLTAGDYFGERALLTGEPRAATIVAQTAVKVMALDRESFDLLLGPLRDLIDHNMNLRILSSIKLFSNLSIHEKTKLSQSFILETFTQGQEIVRQGDPGSKFYILKEGSTRVEVDGNEVAKLKSGSYFGEMALLDDEVRKASVIAEVDCQCFVVDRETFSRILGSMHNTISRETQERLNQLKGTAQGKPDTGSVSQAVSHQLSLKMTDLQQLAVLGSGTFGFVTLVQDRKSKQVYALKAMLKSEIVAHKQQANVLNEKNIMCGSSHPFILKLHQTFKDSKKLYMLLEFVQGGELFSVLHTSNSDGIPNNQARFYAAGVILALAYLHAKDIAYRDMKPENCLIDSNGYPKLVDFGFAKVITGKSYTLCGTPEYLAPELVLARGHTKAVDYWACGILIYEMIAGQSPFSDPNGMDQVTICRNIVSGRLVFPRSFSAECKDLVKRLLSREVQTRLGNLKGGVEDVKAHKWFSGFDFQAMVEKKMEAPWKPAVTSPTDTSNFDTYGVEDQVDDGYVDHGNWDKDF